MSDADTAPRVETKGGAVPYLSIDGAMKAVAFYQKAFGAEVGQVMPPDDKGRTMHAHLYINGSSVMLSDFYPEHGHAVTPVQGFNILLPVTGIDRWWNRAVEAGATAVMPLADMFWGDRYGRLRDPFGVTWALTEPLKAQG